MHLCIVYHVEISKTKTHNETPRPKVTYEEKTSFGLWFQKMSPSWQGSHARVGS